MCDPRVNSVDSRSVLVGLSTHLERLAERIGEVEEALCGLFTVPQNLNAHDAITKFQALDFVRQALEDCALLVHHVALEQDTDRSEYLENSQILRATLKLEATQRLITPDPESRVHHPPAQDGGIDIF